MTMVIHGGGEGVYEEGEDDEKEPLVLRVERVKAPQPHQGILLSTTIRSGTRRCSWRRRKSLA